ncbi:MAG: phosphatase PAP2 family protein [Bdellovibrio sp.]|nr:phosphatase PAP2 family protein [Bdellovibrio sp.]
MRTAPLPSFLRGLFPKKGLPIFLTKKNKYPYGVVLFVLAALLYLPSNHIHFFEPRLLPFWWIDRAVPFIPETVWIYTSEYYFFIVVYLTCKDIVNLNKYFYSFLVLQAVCVLMFWVWPTTYPRDIFPLPSDLDPLTHFIFSSLRAADTPANCCPSLHVSSVYLSSFIFLDDQRKKFPFFFLWATAIAVTTLTTKQHYLVDVIAGLLMALLSYWVFHKYVPYHYRGDQAKR